MKRVLFFLYLIFFSALCFAQQDSNFRVIGRLPGAGDDRTYQIQVGAFQIFQNAEKAFEKLNSDSLNPAYESFFNFTRVVINGVAASDVPSYLQRIQNTGFTEVVIKLDDKSGVRAPALRETVIPADIADDITPAAAIEETPAPFVPPEEVRPIVEIERIANVPRLPAPGNRLPESGSGIGAGELRQQRNIAFSWDAVEGATAYILTIYRETPQGRRQIFITGPVEQSSFTFDNLRLFESTGTFVWQVEALRRNSQGIVEQRGQPGENTLTLNVPRPGQVRTGDTGVLYGN